MIDQEIKRIIDNCKKKAHGFLSENKDKLCQLAEALLEREVLDGNEVREIVGIKDDKAEEPTEDGSADTQNVQLSVVAADLFSGAMIWKTRNYTFDFSQGKKNLLMGILNITPDSFSDGNVYVQMENACERARLLESEGADILDIGAESTRPGLVG